MGNRIKIGLLAALLLANAVIYYDLGQTLSPRPASANIVPVSGCFTNLIATMSWLWGLVYIVHGLWRVYRALRQMQVFSAPPATRLQGAAFLGTGAFLFFLPALMFEYTGEGFLDAAALTVLAMAALLVAAFCYKIAAACRAPTPGAALSAFLYSLLRDLRKTFILLLLPAAGIPLIYYFLLR